MAHNTHHTQHPELPDDPNSPDLIRAALLLKKIWDLDPELRPLPKPTLSDSPDQLSPQHEDPNMLPALERHQRKCAVCHHPDREEIEEEFIYWHNVRQLAKDHDIGDHRSIYSHARAFGLIELRRENRRAMLDRILEAGPDQVGAHGVIEAIRAYNCLTDDNRWVEPPTRVEYSINRVADQSKDARPISTEGSETPQDQNIPDPTPSADPEPASTIPEPPDIIQPEPPPLPVWNGRFASSYGNPRR